MLLVEHASSAAPDLNGLVLDHRPGPGADRVPVPAGWTGPVGADLVLAVAPVDAAWVCQGCAAPDAGPGPAAAESGEDRQLLAIGRRGGPEFLDSELARLFHLASLAGSISSGSRV